MWFTFMQAEMDRRWIGDRRDNMELIFFDGNQTRDNYTSTQQSNMFVLIT